VRILAIESSAMVASVAIVEEEKILGAYTINDKRTHSQTIMPMIQALIWQLDIDIATLDGIGVSSGPGSYTGLRIGSGTAKGLAHVLNIPIVGISTIESMAHNVGEGNYLICPMLDARREHVFSGVYQWLDHQLSPSLAIDQRSIESLCQWLKEQDQPVLFLGDGFTQYESLIRGYLDETSILVEIPSRFLPRAENIGFLALEQLKKGEKETYMTHEPDYYRLSQAERVYRAQQKD